MQVHSHLTSTFGFPLRRIPLPPHSNPLPPFYARFPIPPDTRPVEDQSLTTGALSPFQASSLTSSIKTTRNLHTTTKTGKSSASSSWLTILCFLDRHLRLPQAHPLLCFPTLLMGTTLLHTRDSVSSKAAVLSSVLPILLYRLQPSFPLQLQLLNAHALRKPPDP